MPNYPGLQLPIGGGGARPPTRGQQRPGPDLLNQLFAMKSDKLAKRDEIFQKESFDTASDAYDASLAKYTSGKTAHDASEATKYAAAVAAYDKSFDSFEAGRTSWSKTEAANLSSARSAYDQSFKSYNDGLAAYNANAASQYNAAQSRYNTESSSYKTAKAAYDAQIKAYTGKVATDQKYTAFNDNYNVPNQEFTYNSSTGRYETKILTPYQQTSGGGNVVASTDDHQFLSPTSKTPLERTAIGDPPATFNAATPKFTYTPPSPYNGTRPTFSYTPSPAFTGSTPEFSYKTTPFGSPVPNFNYTPPVSPDGAKSTKISRMRDIAGQLSKSEANAADKRGRNQTNQLSSYYNIFGG